MDVLFLVDGSAGEGRRAVHGDVHRARSCASTGDTFGRLSTLRCMWGLSPWASSQRDAVREAHQYSKVWTECIFSRKWRQGGERQAGASQGWGHGR